ncbi:hypothetical protein ACQ4PT_016423 [Festuca glaucescens]
MLTSALLAETADGTPSLEFGVAELGWWLNGTCAGGREPCAANATCTDVRTPSRTEGHRCACVAGMDGDGFSTGDGCYLKVKEGGGASSWMRQKLPLLAGVCGAFLLSLGISALFVIHRRKRHNDMTNTTKQRPTKGARERRFRIRVPRIPERHEPRSGRQAGVRDLSTGMEGVRRRGEHH